jgi:hypothetical protein
MSTRRYDSTALLAEYEFLLNGIVISFVLDLSKIIFGRMPYALFCRAVGNTLAAVDTPLLIVNFSPDFLYWIIFLSAGICWAYLNARTATYAFVKIEFYLAAEDGGCR